ncbi:GlsB/YeaQ/YmgE family stress response membrane protein [Methylobacterium sp. JK268]
MGLLATIVLGIIGGVVGNVLAAQLHIPVYGFWRNLISATIGAVIVITLYRAVRGQRSTY